MAFQAGGVAQRGGQVRFAQTDGAQENHVGLGWDEPQAEEVLHRQTVDFFGPVPAELFEGFAHWKARRLQAALHQALAALLHITVQEVLQVVQMPPAFFGGLLGQGDVVFLGEGQLEVGQVLAEQFMVHDRGGRWG